MTQEAKVISLTLMGTDIHSMSDQDLETYYAMISEQKRLRQEAIEEKERENCYEWWGSIKFLEQALYDSQCERLACRHLTGGSIRDSDERKRITQLVYNITSDVRMKPLSDREKFKKLMQLIDLMQADDYIEYAKKKERIGDLANKLKTSYEEDAMELMQADKLAELLEKFKTIEQYVAVLNDKFTVFAEMIDNKVDKIT